MPKLPPPQTFAEGQRLVYGLAAGVAGVCFGIAAVVAAGFVIFYPWPPELSRLRLILVGAAMVLATAGSIMVTIGLLVGGPVGRMKTTVTKEQISVEAERGN